MKDYNDFLTDFYNNPDKHEQYLNDILERIKNQLKETAKESSKSFLDKFNL